MRTHQPVKKTKRAGSYGRIKPRLNHKNEQNGVAGAWWHGAGRRKTNRLGSARMLGILNIGIEKSMERRGKRSDLV